MAHGASVASFFVPLACGACGRETEELVATSSVDPAAFNPKGKCSQCGGKLATAVHWNEYVRFLESET